jgi:hypothetical protein
MKFYSRFEKISRVGQKNLKYYNILLAKFSHFWQKKILSPLVSCMIVNFQSNDESKENSSSIQETIKRL